MAAQATAFAKKHGKKYHIKEGTVTKSNRYITTYLCQPTLSKKKVLQVSAVLKPKFMSVN